MKKLEFVKYLDRPTLTLRIDPQLKALIEKKALKEGCSITRLVEVILREWLKND